jgi:hypothetical protein
MKPLVSKGKVVPNDYVEFAKFNAFKGKFYRIKVKSVPIVSCLIGIPIGLFGLISQEYILAIFAFIVLFSTYSLMTSFKNKGKRMFVVNKKFAGATHHVVFGKNGFINEVTYADGNTEHNEYLFSEVDKIYLAPAAVYIYMDKSAVFILPSANIKVTKDEAIAHLSKFVPEDKLVICV